MELLVNPMQAEKCPTSLPSIHKSQHPNTKSLVEPSALINHVVGIYYQAYAERTQLTEQAQGFRFPFHCVQAHVIEGQARSKSNVGRKLKESSKKRSYSSIKNQNRRYQSQKSEGKNKSYSLMQPNFRERVNWKNRVVEQQKLVKIQEPRPTQNSRSSEISRLRARKHIMTEQKQNILAKFDKFQKTKTKILKSHPGNSLHFQSYSYRGQKMQNYPSKIRFGERPLLNIKSNVGQIQDRNLCATYANQQTQVLPAEESVIINQFQDAHALQGKDWKKGKDPRILLAQALACSIMPTLRNEGLTGYRNLESRD